MNKCKTCKNAVCFGAGLLVASILPTKWVCIIAAIVLILTCLSCRR